MPIGFTKSNYQAGNNTDMVRVLHERQLALLVDLDIIETRVMRDYLKFIA